MSTEQCCATCRYWVPTKMYVYQPDAQPHEVSAVETASEMLRATHALCSWPRANHEAAAFFNESPPWVKTSYAAAGTLTREDEGRACVCWEMRPDMELPIGKVA